MKSKKILFVYPGKPLPEHRLKTFAAWKKTGAQIKVLFAYNEQYALTIFDRVLNKLKIPRDSNRLNKRIKRACVDFNPDLVFIVKGVLVKPKTLKFIQRCGAKSVSWSNDDMYAWHNRSLWYTWSLRHYDLVVSQKSYNCNPGELPSLGAKVLFQDKAIDTEINYRVKNCSAFNCVHEVVFIGSEEQDRLEHLQHLAFNGITVHVYGWGETVKTNLYDNLIFHNQHLYGDDFNAALGCSKIALNFLRKMNRDLQTSRSIEIPAAGGFMLTERTIEHERLFTEGVEADYFSTKDELLDKVRYYLLHDSEREKIAKAGYNRVFKSDYTFTNRIAEILDKLYHG